MIVQEKIPYTEDEIKSMVRTIGELRKQVKLLGWHPASELPPVDENGNSPELIVITSDDFLMRVYFNQESKEYSYGVNVKYWCYPPEEK